MLKGNYIKNKIILEYVSGSINSCLQIPNKDKEIQAENIADITRLVKHIENKLHGHFKFSVLSNAFAEEKDTVMIRNNDNYGHNYLYYTASVARIRP